MRRFSLGSLLGFVGLIAGGLAALRDSSRLVNALLFTLMVGLLLAALLGAILLGRRGGAWLGFVVFGWGYLLCDHVPDVSELSEHLPSLMGRWVFDRTNTPPVAPPGFNNGNSSPTPEDLAFAEAVGVYSARAGQSEVIGLWLFVMAFSLVGSLLGGGLSRRLAREGPGDSNHPPAPR